MNSIKEMADQYYENQEHARYLGRLLQHYKKLRRDEFDNIERRGYLYKLCEKLENKIRRLGSEFN